MTPSDKLADEYRKRVAFIGTAFSIHNGVEHPEERLRFDVRDDASFNASCSLDPGGRTAIEVNFGAFAICRDIFFRLLSHPQVWPEIGDVSVETEVPSLFDYYTNANDLLWQGSTTEMPLSVAIPKCPVRGAYADWLDFIACNYLILHELGHALHGHLAFVGGGKALHEIDTKGTATVDCLTRLLARPPVEPPPADPAPPPRCSSRAARVTRPRCGADGKLVRPPRPA